MSISTIFCTNSNWTILCETSTNYATITDYIEVLKENLKEGEPSYVQLEEESVIYYNNGVTTVAVTCGGTVSPKIFDFVKSLSAKLDTVIDVNSIDDYRAYELEFFKHELERRKALF